MKGLTSNISTICSKGFQSFSLLYFLQLSFIILFIYSLNKWECIGVVGICHWNFHDGAMVIRYQWWHKECLVWKRPWWTLLVLQGVACRLQYQGYIECFLQQEMYRVQNFESLGLYYLFFSLHSNQLKETYDTSKEASNQQLQELMYMVLLLSLLSYKS